MGGSEAGSEPPALTDDVDGVVDDDGGRPPASEDHGRRGGPHLPLAIVAGHSVHRSRPGRAVGVGLLAPDEEDPGAVRRQRSARPPVLDRAQLVPLSGPEVVVLHRQVLKKQMHDISLNKLVGIVKKIAILITVGRDKLLLKLGAVVVVKWSVLLPSILTSRV